MSKSYEPFRVIGMAVDPIHVGTGGERLGRVDLSIVRDPVTRVPKIPGSSLAGVCRTYAAMALDKYPGCAGQSGHCGQPNCPICTVFGFARGTGGGFAGLAAFSDAHVLLFPVATRKGPLWVTSPSALRLIGCQINDSLESVLYQKEGGQPLNLGWLLLEVKQHNGWQEKVKQLFCDKDPREYVGQNLGLLRDDLFTHVVNSNLEVRTSRDRSRGGRRPFQLRGTAPNHGAGVGGRLQKSSALQDRRARGVCPGQFEADERASRSFRGRQEVS
jgi:CRISPR-associated protein Cmr4